MSTFGIEFAVTCETKLGEKTCICGNLFSLGQWNPIVGVILETDQKNYPIWSTVTPISIRQGLQVQFKLCILNSFGELVRWEEISGNRAFSPKGSLVIQFTQSDPRMIFKTPRKQSNQQIKVQNVRKGTQEVINEWGSDSSSNREMWREHEFEDEEQGSLLLTQFTNQLTRSVASQRQENFATLQLQPEMQLHEVNFGAYGNHTYHTHYILVDDKTKVLDNVSSKFSSDQIAILKRQNLPKLQLNHKDEISLFHILDWNQSSDTAEYMKLVTSNWKKAANNCMRGLIIVYFEREPNIQLLEGLIEAGLNVFVVNSIESTNNVLTALSNLNYNIFCMKPDVFTARKNQGKQVKLIFKQFTCKDLLTNFEQQMEQWKDKILEHYYFGFEPREFELKLNEKLAVWKMNKSQCLIILQVWKIEDVQTKTLFDLVHLSSQRFKVIVFVITHERFPRNIQNRIPVAKHKVIFLNTFGDIYANTGQVIDLFYYLEIDRGSFESNQNIILEELGSGLQEYSWKNHSLVLKFPHNKLGEVLRRRTLRLVKDINNKSIAKLIIQANGEYLQLVPFCLNLSFMYKVILTTFALRLKQHQKGMIINIDGTDLSTLRFLETPEGPDRSLKFLRFCLRSREHRVNYACNPMSEMQLQKMIQMISEECQQQGTPKKGGALTQIKNIR